MSVRLFAEGNALDSLRNSDFDAVSAWGEVVDNSIEAGAENVRIRLYVKRGPKGYEHIERLVFGDDGSGMDADTLHRCLQIGWSSRFNSRSGIGRFGVGMTMAAIHECKRVEIYSRESTGGWHWTYIDLDEVASGRQADIPEPIKKSPPPEYVDLASDTGTIVVWSKYDRQSDNASRLKEDAIVWMGRTYRYFIWDDGVHIFLDGELIPAIDPLYHRAEQTRFPEDRPAKLYDPIRLNWPVDEYDAPPDAPSDSDIIIRMSLVDESLRPKQGSGNWSATRERFIHENEGVSILRNRREVFYGHVPYWRAGGDGWSSFEEIDRWWGCEIHFDAVLDRAFTVKNIKRGAVPNLELKKAIKAQILPTRNSCIESVRDVWARARQEAREEKKAAEEALRRNKEHLEAEGVAKRTPTDKAQLDSKKKLEDESDDLMKRMGDKYDAEQQAVLKSLFSSQPFTILEDTWKGPQFFESTHLGGSAVLQYNMGHPFFLAVYEKIDALEDGDDPVSIARDMRALLDLLIIGYARGEARFSPDVEMSAEDFLEMLRVNWGQYLQNYVKTWLREKADDESPS